MNIIQEQELARRLAKKAKKTQQTKKRGDKLSSQVEKVTSKLETLQKSYREMCSSVGEKEERWRADQEDLWETRRQTERQMEIKKLILCAFVPQESLLAIEADPSRAQWDNSTRTWHVLPSPEMVQQGSLLPVRCVVLFCFVFVRFASLSFVVLYPEGRVVSYSLSLC